MACFHSSDASQAQKASSLAHSHDIPFLSWLYVMLLHQHNVAGSSGCAGRLTTREECTTFSDIGSPVGMSNVDMRWWIWKVCPSSFNVPWVVSVHRCIVYALFVLVFILFYS